MSADRPQRHILIPRTSIPDGGTVTFDFEASGWPVGGFIYRDGEALYAYANRCAHLPLTLDLATGDLLTEDGSEFVCSNHGARFIPTTGECTWGPCKGRFLETLPIVDAIGPDVIVDITDVDADRPPPTEQ